MFSDTYTQVFICVIINAPVLITFSRRKSPLILEGSIGVSRISTLYPNFSNGCEHLTASGWTNTNILYAYLLLLFKGYEDSAIECFSTAAPSTKLLAPQLVNDTARRRGEYLSNAVGSCTFTNPLTVGDRCLGQ